MEGGKKKKTEGSSSAKKKVQDGVRGRREKAINVPWPERGNASGAHKRIGN